MYFSWHGYRPKQRMHLSAPMIKATSEVSVVIPVKDNREGIDRLLDSLVQTHNPERLPLEVLIISDTRSSIHPQEHYRDYPVKVVVLKTDKVGPASARNIGWQNANGEWILFTDSDCIPSANWLGGYIEASNGSVGYAGAVLSNGQDFISKYYESQGILMPSSSDQNGRMCPDYLITANALVWKAALQRIGGFNESIRIAAGEDIDLGFRLREIGNLGLAASSVVYHDFNDGIVGFMKRFKRYGKGNRILAGIYSLNMKPRGIKARKECLGNSILAYLQYMSLLWGYYVR